MAIVISHLGNKQLLVFRRHRHASTGWSGDFDYDNFDGDFDYAGFFVTPPGRAPRHLCVQMDIAESVGEAEFCTAFGMHPIAAAFLARSAF